MKANPQLDRFLSRLAVAMDKGPIYAGEDADIKRIELVDPSIDNIVGRLMELDRSVGAFRVLPTGEVIFRYNHPNGIDLYVNRGLNEFRASVQLFNVFTWSMSNPDDPECACFPDVVFRFKQALEKIEPLGDSATSLWSATIDNTDQGLWTLY